MAQATAMARHPGAKRRRGFVLPLWLGGVVTLAAFVGLVHMLWARWPGYALAPDAPSVPIAVGGLVFNVPPSAVRMAVQRHPGAQPRLDLAFLWPSLAAPEPNEKPLPSDAPVAIDRLFITIAAHDKSLSQVEMMKLIYPRYFTSDPAKLPSGLIMAPFRDGTPYQGEDLFYSASNPDDFIARCSRPAAGDVPGQCFYQRRIGAIDLTVRFPRDWLGQWGALVKGIDRLIAAMRPLNG